MRDSVLPPPSPAAREQFRRRLALTQKLALAIEITTTYARVRWWLRTREFRAVLEAVRASATDDPLPPDGDQLLAGVRLGRVVGRTLGALPADSKCLVRSLVLAGLLARRRIACTVVIGVSSEPEFTAHAWVEHGGYPLLTRGDRPYARLIEL